MFSLIEEAATIRSFSLVVFTGGECFLLGETLDALIRHATVHSFKTRCVTNGYWARTPKIAAQRLARLKSAGLTEINFSTGPYHAKFVDPERVVLGALAAREAKLTTVVNVETDERDVKHSGELVERLRAQIGDVNPADFTIRLHAWMPNDGAVELTYPANSKFSRFQPHRKTGCETVLNVVAVTPNQRLIACCGFHLERIPNLDLGSVAEESLQRLLIAAEDDFLKIWLHVEGPERILEFAKALLPGLVLPEGSVHPCETCRHLHQSADVMQALRMHYAEVVPKVLSAFYARRALQTFHAQQVERLGHG